MASTSMLQRSARFDLARIDRRGQARALSIVSWRVFIVLTVLLGFGVLLEPETLVRRAITLAAVGGLVIVLHMISQGGRPRLASWIFVIGLCVIVTQRAWVAGGIRAPVAILYLALVVMAGSILGTRGAVVTAACCMTGATVLTIGTTRGQIAPQTASAPGGFLVVLLAIGIALVIHALVTFRLAAELADTKLLHTLSTELVAQEDSSALHEKIVDAALSIMRADFATFQIFHPERGAAGELRLVATRGVSPDAQQKWGWIAPDGNTTCAQALRIGTRVVLADIEQGDFMAGTDDQAGLLAEGVRAAQTTPLVSRGGHTVGMISTYWREKHVPSERELHLLDILARQAADLTERSQSNEVLRRNERELKEADARKEEFLATLAHELRNPLAPIRNAVTFLNVAEPLGPDAQWARDVILDQTVQLARLVDDLLDVSRINLGRLELHIQRSDITDVLASVVETNRFLLEERNHRLTVDMPSEPLMVDGDATRLTQVFFNLLDNAAKFSEAGTNIVLSVDAGPNEVRVQVRDEGIGIAATDLPHVFDLFTQITPLMERNGRGLGIGLALVKRVVEMHGGRITASSEGLGRGSEFTVVLPRLAVAKTQESPSVGLDVIEPTGVPMRVLIVDDHEAGAMSMARLLRAFGYEARHSTDALEGLDAAAAFRPDAVLLDIGMPKIDGYEIARRIRREGWGRAMLLIAVTGWGQPSDKQRAADAGFDHHLTKPVDVGDVTGLLAGVGGRVRVEV